MGTFTELHAMSKLKLADGSDRWPQLTAKMQELVEQQFISIRRDLKAYTLEKYDHRRSLLDWADCWHRALSRPNMAIRETELTQAARQSLQDLECEGLVDPKVESSSVSAVNVSKAVQISVTLSFTDDEGRYALARFIWSRKWNVSYRRGVDPSFQPAPNGATSTAGRLGRGALTTSAITNTRSLSSRNWKRELVRIRTWKARSLRCAPRSSVSTMYHAKSSLGRSW
jgi:hypothetical protein